jgi:hypothetical protein
MSASRQYRAAGARGTAEGPGNNRVDPERIHPAEGETKSYYGVRMTPFGAEDVALSSWMAS